MMKGKPSYPFETIAVAVNFNPHTGAVISEARRLADTFKAKTIFINAEKRSSGASRQLTELLQRHNFSNANSKIVNCGSPAVDEVLSVCKDEIVDLLIIDASEGESEAKHYHGNNWQEIALKAKCSVLLMAEPRLNGLPYRQIVVNGHDHPKTMPTIEAAIYIATKEKAAEITVANGISISRLTVMADASLTFETETDVLEEEIIHDEISRLNNEMKHINLHGLKINIKPFSTRQTSISSFARSIDADLLVVNSSDHHLSIFDRIAVNDVEELLTDLPCNTLIVHSRVY